MRSASIHAWTRTAAVASVSALAVTIAGLSGFRSGQSRVEDLELQIQRQQATITQLSADLDRVRGERDRLAAELRDKGLPANRPKTSPRTRPDGEPFDRQP